MQDKAKRIKYIRVLEKFFKQNLALIRLENFNFELYQQRTLKNFSELQKSEKVDLHSNYLMGLKRHIDSIMQFAHHGSDDIEEKKNTLLKDANTLLRDKNQSNYKKDKHKNKKFDDGY